MKLRTRRALWAAAWTVFGIGAPILLGVASGYRLQALFRPQRSLPVPEIGALVVSTSPRGASVRVDGRALDATTPTGVGGLPGGTHTVQIERDGYRPYEKRLDIAGGRVTDLLHVLLVPTTVPEERVADAIDAISVSPDEQSVALVSGRMLEVFSVEELARAQGEKRTPRVRVAVPLGVSEIVWSPNGGAIALGRSDKTASGGSEAFALLTLEDGLAHRLPLGRTLVGWFPDGETLALRSPRGALSAVRRDTLLERTFLQGALQVTVHPRGVLGVLTNPEREGVQMTLVMSSGFTEPATRDVPFVPAWVKASRRGDLAVADERGGLHLWVESEKAWHDSVSSVTSALWSPDGEKLLLQTSEFDLFVLNIAEERSVLPLEQPTFLVRLSVPLSTPQWLPDSQHVLFVAQDVLTLLEIDPRDGPRRDTLVSLERGDPRLAILNRGKTLLVTARRPDITAAHTLRPVLLRLLLRTTVDSF